MPQSAPFPQPPRYLKRCPAGTLPALLLAVLLTVLLASGCAARLPPAQRLERYETALQRPLAERVIPADEAVLERAHRTNLDYGEDVRPTAAASDHPVAGLARRVLASLPEPVARLARRHLAAVTLVQGDIGTATTEAVGRGDAPWRHAYILLNVSSLTRNANAWATWKEGSTFHPDPASPHGLRMTLEPPRSDDLEGAVRFILLHELGHVIGLGARIHDPWEDDPRPIPGEAYTFQGYDWLRDAGGAWVPRSKATQPLPHATGFYQFDKAPLKPGQADAVYAQLEATTFPSLYGATNRWDDFAETFAIYVHTRLLGKPYRVEVLRAGEPVRSYRSCLQRGACPRKAAFMQALLGGG